MKKGRENNQFLPRKFVLSEIDNTIKYYVKVKVRIGIFLEDTCGIMLFSSGPERPQSSHKNF